MAAARAARRDAALTLAIALALAAAAAPSSAAAAAAMEQPLCACWRGAFVMLAGDKGAYRSVPGGAGGKGGGDALGARVAAGGGRPPRGEAQAAAQQLHGLVAAGAPRRAAALPPRGSHRRSGAADHAAQLEGVAPAVGVSAWPRMRAACTRPFCADGERHGRRRLAVPCDGGLGRHGGAGPDTMRPAIEGIADKQGGGPAAVTI